LDNKVSDIIDARCNHEVDFTYLIQLSSISCLITWQ